MADACDRYQYLVRTAAGLTPENPTRDFSLDDPLNALHTDVEDYGEWHKLAANLLGLLQKMVDDYLASGHGALQTQLPALELRAEALPHPFFITGAAAGSAIGEAKDLNWESPIRMNSMKNSSEPRWTF